MDSASILAFPILPSSTVDLEKRTTYQKRLENPLLPVRIILERRLL